MCGAINYIMYFEIPQHRAGLSTSFYTILKPGEEIRPPIYSIPSHCFYLNAHRLMPKFPILLVELIVQQKK
jgi:hypothetical protein